MKFFSKKFHGRFP